MLVQWQKGIFLIHLWFWCLKVDSNICIISLSINAEEQCLIWKRIWNFVLAHWVLAERIDRDVRCWRCWWADHFRFDLLLGWFWRSNVHSGVLWLFARSCMSSRWRWRTWSWIAGWSWWSFTRDFVWLFTIEELLGYPCNNLSVATYFWWAWITELKLACLTNFACQGWRAQDVSWLVGLLHRQIYLIRWLGVCIWSRVLTIAFNLIDHLSSLLLTSGLLARSDSLALRIGIQSKQWVCFSSTSCTKVVPRLRALALLVTSDTTRSTTFLNFILSAEISGIITFDLWVISLPIYYARHTLLSRIEFCWRIWGLADNCSFDWLRCQDKQRYTYVDEL